MVISAAQRRDARRIWVEPQFGPDATTALDLLDLADLAWHDCYGEVTFPDRVLDDLLLLAGGDVRALVSAAKLAVVDWRDLRVAADARRG